MKGKPNIISLSLSTAHSNNHQLSVDLAVEEICIREKLLKINKKMRDQYPSIDSKNSTYFKQSFLH